MGFFIVAILGLAGGFVAGWYLRSRGESYRKQALEATHGEFIRAASLARDRAKGEAEDLELRFQRFRQEHERASRTIFELRETVAALEARLAGHDSTLDQARTQIEDHERKVELRIQELEQVVEQKTATASADGTPRWLLSKPLNGHKDDLTAIRGLGPGFERKLNGMGIFHYSQLARLQPTDIEWLAKRIRAYPGRIRKDQWVEQARRMQPTPGADH